MVKRSNRSYNFRHSTFSTKEPHSQDYIWGHLTRGVSMWPWACSPGPGPGAARLAGRGGGQLRSGQAGLTVEDPWELGLSARIPRR